MLQMNAPEAYIQFKLKLITDEGEVMNCDTTEFLKNHMPSSMLLSSASTPYCREAGELHGPLGKGSALHRKGGSIGNTQEWRFGFANATAMPFGGQSLKYGQISTGEYEKA